MGEKGVKELALKVGDVVDGRYRLLELLGEGAAGKVFRAEDLGNNNQFIALKLLHAKDPRWENFFRREFDVLTRVQHPNLVRVYDFGPAPQDNTYYFTQELVVGKPLLDIVMGKKVDEVAGLFIEICRALEFIHGHGVLHRDLKPANILVQMHAEPGERVRVLDFGLWRELDPTPQKGARWAGTPPYLASEVLRGYGHSISADLYAVGVTLFQGVTRKLPHGRGTPQELLAARKTPAPDLTGVVAQPIADVVARLLDEDPASRPATAAEVAAALSSLVPHHAFAMPITLGRARLIGRDLEQDALAQALTAVREGQANAPRLVIVEGDDGVGKSRLSGEIKATVQLEGGRSAIGRCMEDVRWSYRPISELVRALAPIAQSDELSDAEREVIQRLCPDLADSALDVSTPLPKGERERFHQAAADLFLRLAHDRPGVLIVEDVPYCDAASTALLSILLRRAREAQLLIVVTAGPQRQHGPVPRELVDAAGRDVVRLHLNPLPREEVRRLIAALLGVPDVPDGLTDAIMAHAHGNPLLVEELVALFIDRGDLARGEHGWDLEAFDAGAVAPAHVLEVLNERLQRLTENERRTLSALAVFNRPTGPKLLSHIAGITRAEARQSLSSTETLGLIRVVGEEEGRPRVVFRHPQIRDALIEDLQKGGVLKMWHHTAADVLEERAEERGGADAIAETLAHHYEAASMAEPALRWLMRAATHAMTTFAFDDAIALARRASRLLIKAKADIETVVQCDVLVGKALLFSGRIPEARAFLEGAVARADAVGAPEGFGELHVWLGRACNQLGAVDQGMRAVDRALGLLSDDEHPLAYARLLCARGELNQRSDPAKALTDTERALKLMPEPRTVGDELGAFEVLTVAAYYAGDRDRSIKYARHRVKITDRAARPLEKITALRHLATALGVTGQRLEARKHLNTALRLAQDSGHRVEEALLVKALGDQLYVSGQYNEAITRFQEAVKLSADMGQQADRADALKYLGECYLAKGEYDRAVDHLKAALDAFDKSGQLANVIAARCYLSNALIAKGDIEEAEKVLRVAAKRLPADGLSNARAEVYCSQGNLFSARNDFERARIAYLHAIALCRQSKDLFSLGEAMVGYGQLLLRFKKPGRALRMAKRADWIFTDLDARGQLKRLQPLINAASGLTGGKKKATKGGAKGAGGKRSTRSAR
jgi:tetratricopeptide (TPR) repeat protein